MKVSKMSHGSIEDMRSAMESRLEELENTTANVDSETNLETEAPIQADTDETSEEEMTPEVIDKYIDDVMNRVDTELESVDKSVLSSWNWNKLENEEGLVLITVTEDEIMEYTIPYADLTFENVDEDVTNILKALNLTPDDASADVSTEDEDWEVDASIDVDNQESDKENIEAENYIEVDNGNIDDESYVKAIINEVNSHLEAAKILDSWTWEYDESDRIIQLTTIDGPNVYDYMIPVSDLSGDLNSIKTDVKYILSGINDMDEVEESDVYSCDQSSAILSNRDDLNYFGETAAKMFGDKIANELKGKRISKRRDLAHEPGGLIYEADALDMDMWDLLEALEGMCVDRRAKEIDDSTYLVVGGEPREVTRFVRASDEVEELDGDDKTVEIYPGDDEILYEDVQNMLGDEQFVSLEDIKTIWNNSHDSDPSVVVYRSFDEWWKDTRAYLEAVDASSDVEEEEILGWSDSYDDESEESSIWKEISSKSVPDSNGFSTDYTLYESMSDETEFKYICMFGDKDIYAPDENYADWSGDSLHEAEEWFESYSGFDYEDDDDYSDYEYIDSSTDDDVMSSENVYVLVHGFGPGTLPRDVQILNHTEDEYCDIVELDRELTDEELNFFDIRKQHAR